MAAAEIVVIGGTADGVNRPIEEDELKAVAEHCSALPLASIDGRDTATAGSKLGIAETEESSGGGCLQLHAQEDTDAAPKGTAVVTSPSESAEMERVKQQIANLRRRGKESDWEKKDEWWIAECERVLQKRSLSEAKRLVEVIKQWADARGRGPVDTYLSPEGGWDGDTEGITTILKQTCRFDWRRWSDEQLSEIACDFKLPIEAVQSLRCEIQKSKSAEVNNSKLAGLAPAMAEKMRENGSILNVCDYDVPPIRVLRAVYQEMEGTPMTMGIVESGAWYPKWCQAAMEHDEITGFDQQDQHAAGVAHESYVEQLLHKSEVRVDDRVSEGLMQSVKESTSLDCCTPDFFIPGGLKLLDGTVIRWIDAKSNFGTASDGAWLTRNKLKEQAKKYVNRFGPGALLFGKGFDANLQKEMRLHDVYLLDKAFQPRITDDDVLLSDGVGAKVDLRVVAAEDEPGIFNKGDTGRIKRLLTQKLSVLWDRVGKSYAADPLKLACCRKPILDSSEFPRL